MNELDELQRQADINRDQFLKAELDLCHTLIEVTKTELIAGTRAHAEQSFAHAEKGYATLKKFLSDPKHSGRMSTEWRSELEKKTEQVGDLLEQTKKMFQKS